MTDTTRSEERLAALIGTPAPAPAGTTVDLFFLSPEDLERLDTFANSWAATPPSRHRGRTRPV